MGDLFLRAALRRAALRYAGHGWPVVPGAVLVGERYVCGPLCPTVACHPAIDCWEQWASVDLSIVEQWWRARAYSILLATGVAFDVIEVPNRLGRAVGHRMGPVAVTPTGRWMFLVRTGEALRPELAAMLDVVLHGRGSWIPAPPTRAPEGRVRWSTSPEQHGWRLPDSSAVQRQLVAALPGLGPAPTFITTTPALRSAA